jgi:hypothetical protein
VQNVTLFGTAKRSSHDLPDMTFLWLMSVDSVLLLKVRPTTRVPFEEVQSTEAF